MMKVLTLNDITFKEHCARLQEAAREYAPDLIVSIANGGTYVAACMFDDVKHVDILCRRRSTSSKERRRRLFKVVRSLPTFMKNWLRIIEASWLKRQRPANPQEIKLDQQTVGALTSARRILVVDDAVDSGQTLLTVLTAIKNLGVSATIKSAVFTITTKSPATMPDIYLYNNSTLIRFPWSKDVKNS